MGLRVRLLHLQGRFERVEGSQQGLWVNRAYRVQSSEIFAGQCGNTQRT